MGVVEYDFRTKEQKREEVKDKLKSKLRNAKNWVRANKEESVALAIAAIGGLTSITKLVIKHANISKEESNKNLYCYDRSLGHYWRLRRELSNSEWIEIERRKNNGEHLGDILSELKVLK